MILKGNQRGGARPLAYHMVSDENDHHRILALEGFCASNLHDALLESYAISKGTQCKKIFFTVIISPPKNVTVLDKQITDVVGRIQKQFKLEKQSYALVEHEKEGRKHYHLIIPRIDTDKMKAIELGLYKKALNEMSLNLFIENKWDIPKGFNIGQPDPRSFTLSEWQQSKRLGTHPKYIKAAIKQCWDHSDNRQAFTAALAEKGVYLAKGDRRNCFVAVTWQGEIIPMNKKNLGVTAKAIKNKLGEPDTAPSIKTMKATIAAENDGVHQRLRRELSSKHQAERQPLTLKKLELVNAQRNARAELMTHQQQRFIRENTSRQQRMRKGLRGLWDFMTGQSSQQKQRNEEEAKACAVRDIQERTAMMNQHINHRHELQQIVSTLTDKQHLEAMALNAGFVKHSQGLELKGDLMHELKEVAPVIKPDHSPELGL